MREHPLPPHLHGPMCEELIERLRADGWTVDRLNVDHGNPRRPMDRPDHQDADAAAGITPQDRERILANAARHDRWYEITVRGWEGAEAYPRPESGMVQARMLVRRSEIVLSHAGAPTAIAQAARHLADQVNAALNVIRP